MPPKVRYTKEQIVAIAYEMVRRDGEDSLTARNLAAALKTSTAPIFTAFSGIEEVRETVIERAKALYRRYSEEGLSMDPPFKGAGLKYIQFAKDEPKLFQLLFMRGNEGEALSHYMPSGYEQEKAVRDSVSEVYRMDEEKARRIYNHLSVYSHGLAVLYVQGRAVFSDEDVSRMLSEIFLALTKGDKHE